MAPEEHIVASLAPPSIRDFAPDDPLRRGGCYDSRMNPLIRIALVALMAAVAGGVRTGAQAPNNAQAQRNQLANQPAPRTSDGRIVLGNTAKLKGVWIGGGLGFCNANTVAAPASLNPGAAGARGAGPGGAGAPFGGRGRGAAAMHSGPIHAVDPCCLE